jgi:hypothetical protein
MRWGAEGRWEVCTTCEWWVGLRKTGGYPFWGEYDTRGAVRKSSLLTKRLRLLLETGVTGFVNRRKEFAAYEAIETHAEEVHEEADGYVGKSSLLTKRLRRQKPLDGQVHELCGRKEFATYDAIEALGRRDAVSPPLLCDYCPESARRWKAVKRDVDVPSRRGRLPYRNPSVMVSRVRDSGRVARGSSPRLSMSIRVGRMGST